MDFMIYLNHDETLRLRSATVGTDKPKIPS